MPFILSLNCDLLPIFRLFSFSSLLSNASDFFPGHFNTKTSLEHPLYHLQLSLLFSTVSCNMATSTEYSAMEDDSIGDGTGELLPSSTLSQQIDWATSAVAVTVTQVSKSLSLLDASSSLVTSAAASNCTFEQKLAAAQEARKTVEVANNTIEKATALFTSIGITVSGAIQIDLSALFPQKVAQPAQISDDTSLPSASRYYLNMSYLQGRAADILPHKLMDMKLKGSGCQLVERKSSPTSVSVRFMSRAQLSHALGILQAATYKDSPLSSFCSFATTMKSAYAIRTLPFKTSLIDSWLTADGKIDLDKAINSLQDENEGWFANNAVESVERWVATGPRGSNTPHSAMKISISHEAYRSFLRAPRDCTNIMINGELVSVNEEVNIIQCWRCCQFGHYSNQCTGKFECRTCLSEHPQGSTCPSANTPSCRNCARNNDALTISNPDSTTHHFHFEGWSHAQVNHAATSGACKTIQQVKRLHRNKLKKAAFLKLPLPTFTFP